MTLDDEPPYPRDLVGYGADPPDAAWPGGARIAVQFVINYEEGGERCLLHGDSESEAFLSDIVGAAPLPARRHMSMESLYDYGARAGFWRLMRLFGDRGLPVTAFAVGMALARNPDAARALAEAGHEVASHGWRWIDYQDVDPETEADHIARAHDTIEALVGTPPVGMYQGRTSPNTVALTAAHGGFLYSADSYADDLPYWHLEGDTPLLMVPYTLDANDMRFATAQGFNSGDQFFAYLRDAFDMLYAEGAERPPMMSVGLHCRLAGRPGRALALARFLDHVQGHDRVWVCRREDIARHWIDRFPAPAYP